MESEFHGRLVLVIGATGRIGRVITEDLLGRGATVVAVGRSQESSGALAEGLAAHTAAGQLHVVSADLAAPRAATALAEQLASAGQHPAGLVFSARDLGALRAPPREAWLSEFMLAVVTPDELLEALVRDPRCALEAVVHVSSMYGLVVPPRSLYAASDQRPPRSYGVTKAAALQLAKEQAVAFAPRGIRVNAVAYGGVRGRADASFEARYSELAPSGRMLDDGDLAGSVAFLLSRSAASVTGHTLVVDGGWTLW